MTKSSKRTKPNTICIKYEQYMNALALLARLKDNLSILSNMLSGMIINDEG